MKKSLSVAVALIVLLSLTLALALPAYATVGIASYCSNGNPSGLPEYVADGSMYTYWYCSTWAGESAWIALDGGSVASLSEIRWNSSGGVDLQISVDAEQWIGAGTYGDGWSSFVPTDPIRYARLVHIGWYNSVTVYEFALCPLMQTCPDYVTETPTPEGWTASPSPTPVGWTPSPTLTPDGSVTPAPTSSGGGGDVTVIITIPPYPTQVPYPTQIPPFTQIPYPTPLATWTAIPTATFTPTMTPLPPPSAPGYSNVSTSDWRVEGVGGLLTADYDFGCPINIQNEILGSVRLCIVYTEIQAIEFLGQSVPLWPFVGALVLVVVGFFMRR